jgi:hypothetical protein
MDSISVVLVIFVLNIHLLDVQICLKDYLLPLLFFGCPNVKHLIVSPSIQNGIGWIFQCKFGLYAEIRHKMCSTLTGITHFGHYLQCQLRQKALICIQLIYPNLVS